MRYGRYFILLLLLCGNYIHAQTLGGNAVFSFLRQPVGARTWALGGNNISSMAQDVSLAFQQPALLRPVHDGQISSSIQSFPAGIRNYSLVAAAKLSVTSYMS
ncbi:MAG: hypothetical protein ACK5A2_12815 [Bacteroidota bacterium]